MVVRSRWIAVVSTLLCAAALPLAGCDVVVYTLTTIRGELDLLARAVPIEQALQDDTLSDEQREKLAFVIRARDYAEGAIGLNVASAYQSFVNLRGEPLAWNLSASETDRFEPYIWQFPVAGALPYIGFFNYEQATTEQSRLLGLGYDTVMYEVDAYSTLGLLPDPITSSLLNRDLVSLADTVIHESLHNTIYRPGNSDFNESLATFVGRTGAIQFLQQEFGPDAEIITEAREGYEDADRLNAFLQSLMAELRELYDSDLSKDETIAGRQEIFNAARARFSAEVLPLMHNQQGYAGYATFAYNNAFLLLNTRYNSGLDLFEQVYDLAGGDWAQAMSLFAQAAAAEDAYQYMRDLVGAGAAD